MVDTKSLEATRKKWEESHGRVQTAYKDGINRTVGWKEKAIAGEELYAQKVQEAVASRRRAKKLEGVSETEWKSNAAGKGAARIGAGMAASKEKYAKGMGRVLETIQATTIAPRSADAMANVDNRVKPIVAALKKLKEE